VRTVTVQLRGPWRPGPWQEPLPITAVEREVDAPAGVTPIRWVLLTDWPCESYEQARRVIGTYTRRWLIEEYHKALKSGTGIEQSQLTTAARITVLLGILAVVAVRLLDLKLLAATQPDAPVAADDLPAGMLLILETMYGRPAGGWTNRTALVAIAKLGGFLARKAHGNPGWQILWRGWDKLILLVQGYHLATRQRCG